MLPNTQPRSKPSNNSRQLLLLLFFFSRNRGKVEASVSLLVWNIQPTLTQREKKFKNNFFNMPAGFSTLFSLFFEKCRLPLCERMYEKSEKCLEFTIVCCVVFISIKVNQNLTFSRPGERTVGSLLWGP